MKKSTSEAVTFKRCIFLFTHLCNSSSMVLNTAYNSCVMCRTTNWAGTPSCSSPSRRTRYSTAATTTRRRRRPFTINRRYLLILFSDNFDAFEFSHLKTSTASSRTLSKGQYFPNESSIPNTVFLDLGLALERVKIWLLR